MKIKKKLKKSKKKKKIIKIIKKLKIIIFQYQVLKVKKPNQKIKAKKK